MRLKTGLLLLPLVLFGTAGCGDENTPKACDGVVCGAHASCNESTGACACEAGYSGDATAGCTEDAKCTETTCSGHGTCSVPNGTPVCACSGNWAGDACDRCTNDYVLEDGACINTKQVDCIAPSPVPAHAQVVSAKVEIAYTTANGWSTAASCAVECDAGYVAEGEEGACINSKQVACIAPTTLPAHAHSVEAMVTIDYVDGAWETAATCQTACDAGYVGEGAEGACINSKQVACIAPTTLPANAHSVEAMVTVNYVDGAWQTAATCQTDCNDDYVAEGTDGACINSKEVHCVAPTAIPENAHSVDAVHTVTYADGAWGTIPTCQIACNTGWAGEGCTACDSGYVSLEGGCFLDSCAAAPCQNGGLCDNTSIGYTCDCEPNYGGTECQECANGYVAIGETTPLSCVSNLCTETTCGANATCSMVADGQTACACVDGYVDEGTGCINTKEMACDETAIPANAIAIQAPVTANWVNGAWVAPACEWFCEASFHVSGGACVVDAEILWCNVWPDTFNGVAGESEAFNGLVRTTLTAATQGQTPGIDGQFCYSTSPITSATPISELTCVDAAFLRETTDANADDEYQAIVEFAQAGSFNYVFAFSGDGKASWTLCNTSADVNGVATVTEPPGTLIFSEYVEGSSSNKAIEIFNATGAEKDVTGCTIELYTNGSPTVAVGNTFTFPAGHVLPVNGTYAICNSAATQALKDLCKGVTHNVTNFNGNDALVLKCGGEVLDVFGQVGFDPGSAGWGTVPSNTTDKTLRRACSVHFGDTVANDAFDPAAQWEFFEKDTFTGIGEHCPVVTDACNPDPCNGKGTCSVTTTGFSCECSTGYAGDTCDTCATDYVDEGAGCINTKQVACIAPDPMPANSQSVDAQVTVTYSNGAWSTAASCQTTCLDGFIDEGAGCINEKSVHCLPPETIPANTHSVDAMVTVTYSNGAWTTADTCATACDAGYIGATCTECDTANGYSDIGGGICATDNCGAEPCKNGGVCSSTSESYTCECAPTFSGATCEECAVGFVAMAQSPLTCVADLCIGQDCGGHGTCSMASATEYTCACADGYVFEGGSCINSKMVACTDAAPANATSTTAQVEITWNGTDWTTPAACEWTCNTGYGLVGNECLNQQTVACTTPATVPENAHSVTTNVTITFDGTNWATPADCAWACNDNFHLSGNACIANVNIGWCNVQFPKDFTGPVGDGDVFYGRFYAPETEATVGAKAAGVDAKFCYGVGPIAADTDLSSLTCEVAEFNVEVDNNDEYQALVQFDVAGAYDYVYAFSGDGKQTWKICDADDLDTVWTTGKATILAPFNVASATATSATTVTVTFNRAVKTDTVLIDGTQFEVFASDASAELVVSAAAVNGSVVTLTVDPQVPGTEYTVFVANTVKDVALETAVPANAEATFVGYSAPVPVVLQTAAALSNTSVVLTFDKALDASTVSAGDFTIVPALAVTDVLVAGGNVTLTTESQAAIKYTVTVGDVLATDGAALDSAANSQQFDGIPAVVAAMPVNGDFESWTDGEPDAWTADSGAGTTQESTIVRGGSYSVKLTRNSTTNGDTDFVSTMVPVTAGTSYKMSFWYLDNNTNARGSLNYQFFKSDLTQVAAVVYSNIFTTNMETWQEITKTVAAPAGAAFVQVSTRVLSESGGTATGGFVYLDDVTVTAQ